MTDTLKENLTPRLRAWGRWLNLALMDAGCPPKHPDAQSWAQQIRNPGDTLPTALCWDEDEMERISAAHARLGCDDMQAHLLLVWHFRDGRPQDSRKLRAAIRALRGYL